MKVGIIDFGYGSYHALEQRGKVPAPQAAGKFEKGDDGFVLVPDRFYIGSFPLHRLPGLSSQVLGVIMNRMQIPEDLKVAWKKLANVTVEGSTLKLTMP